MPKFPLQRTSTSNSLLGATTLRRMLVIEILIRILSKPLLELLVQPPPITCLIVPHGSPNPPLAKEVNLLTHLPHICVIAVEEEVAFAGVKSLVKILFLFGSEWLKAFLLILIKEVIVIGNY